MSLSWLVWNWPYIGADDLQQASGNYSLVSSMSWTMLSVIVFKKFWQVILDLNMDLS